MMDIDLKGPNRYHPLDTLSPAQVFDLGVQLARKLPHLRVLAPVGDEPDEVVTLSGRVLSKKGVEVF